MSKATLAGRAAALAAGGNGQQADTAPAAQTRAAAVEAEPAELPDVDLGESPQDWDQMPVHIAWLRVMREVRSLGKDGEYKPDYGKKAGQVVYRFRGVDHALNVFGPACRKHGVLILPIRVETSYRDAKTSGGSSMRECTATVTYRITGPKGDYLDVQVAGEGVDTSDKATAKAQSVALRILLLHGGLVPTSDPDPDASNIERGEAMVRPPASYATEILHRGTSRQRMMQIRHELAQHRMTEALATNEHGQQEPLLRMLERVDRQRLEEWQRSQQAAAAPQAPPVPVDDGVPEPPADVAARLAAEQAALFAGAEPLA